MRSRPWSALGWGVVAVALALLGWALWTSSRVPDLLVLRPVERRPLGPGLDGSGLSRAPRAASEGRCGIVGSVSRSGRPEGAQVVVCRLGETGHLYGESHLLVQTGGDERPAHSTPSAHDGTYALHGLSPGTWHLLARASDGAQGWAAVELRRDGQIARCDVELLAAGRDLHGTVRDQHGRPWGRTIGAVAPPYLAYLGGEALSTATIDADGRFALPGLAPSTWGLTFEGEGVLRAFVGGAAGVATPREMPLDVLVHRPDANLVVRVVEARGAAVVIGARVEARWRAAHRFEVAALVCNHGITDASGEASLAVATPCSVVVHADGYMAAFEELEAGVLDLTVELRRASRVVGRVLRADTREGVAGVRVEVNCSLSRAVVTDAQGRYVIEGVAAGSWRIEARGPGWVSLGALGARDEAWDPLAIEVPDGVEVEHDIFVEAAASIEGRVLDPAGLPVAGAWVHVRGLGMGEGTLWRVPAAVTTDDGGRYSIEGLPPEASVVLVATAPRHGAGTSPVVRTVAGSTHLDLTLTAARWLEVRVLSERDAAPLPLAAIHLGSHLDVGDVRTDTDGRARVGPVREGDALHVSAEGHLSQRLDAPSAGEVEVRLAPGLPIAGRVLDANGVPVVGVGVSMISEDYEHADALTGLDGTFRAPGVSPGTWNLRVSAGEARASVDVEAGTLDVELRLATRADPLVGLPKHLVHVRVSTASGAPALSGRVALLHAGGSEQVRLWEGRAALHLPRHANTAPFHVVVWDARDPDGVVQGPTSAGPFPASEREVEVTLRPPLMGWIKGLPTELASGVVVEAYPYLKSWGWAEFLRAAPADLEGLYLPSDAKLSARCLADGSFRIDGLADMPFALVARLPPGWVQDDEVVAEPGDMVKLKVSRGVDVVVTVLGGSGEPLPDAQVRAHFDVDHPPHEDPLWNGHSTASEWRTDAEGRLRLRGLRPDEVYALSVEPPDEALHFKHYEEEWAPRDTTVRLRPAYVVEGTVRDAAGNPVEEAAVALWVTGPEGVKRKFTTTDEQGRFSFETLPAGPYPAQAARSYHDLPRDPGPEASVLVAGTRDATFVVEPGVSLLLQPASKGPSVFRKVLVYVREGASLREVRDEFVRFGGEPTLLRALPPGLRYVVWIPPDEEDPRYSLFEEVDPAAGPVVVALRDGATLSLHVEGSTELPEVGWATATSEAGLTQRLRPDAQGHVRGFPPGRWSLRVKLRGSHRGEFLATVEVGSSDLEVTLRPK